MNEADGDANARTQAPSPLTMELHGPIAQNHRAPPRPSRLIWPRIIPRIPAPSSPFPTQARIQAKGVFVKCLGEAADIAGGSDKHLLNCELNLFDVKINRSKLVRTTKASPCHALHEVVPALAASQRCDALRTAPAAAPVQKQVSDGAILLLAPNRRGFLLLFVCFAGSSPCCDFDMSFPLFGKHCPQSL